MLSALRRSVFEGLKWPVRNDIAPSNSNEQAKNKNNHQSSCELLRLDLIIPFSTPGRPQRQAYFVR